jgi:hypothetical protein
MEMVMTRFSKLDLDESGRPVETDVREIPQRAIMLCPHFILMAEHYRADGTCRCNDESHTEMREWGYDWRGGLWQSPPDDDQ